MLTLIAYRFSVDGSLPKVSYLTSLDMFIMLSTIIVFLALIQVLLKAHISKKDDRYIIAKRMDLVCRGLFPLLFLGIGYMSFFAYKIMPSFRLSMARFVFPKDPLLSCLTARVG